jgi:hypothetical protein
MNEPDAALYASETVGRYDLKIAAFRAIPTMKLAKMVC